MKRLGTAKRYQYFCETLNDCGMFLLECSKEEIEHRIFENLDIEFRAFLCDESLQKLLKKGYIDSNVCDLSLKLHGMLQDIFQGPLWKSECVTTAPEWQEILKLSDEIKEYQKKSSVGFYSGKVREIKMLCYPKYAYYFNLIFSIAMLLFTFVPLAIPSKTWETIVLVTFCVVSAVIMFLGYLWNRQYAIISEGTISVKNCFTTIVTLDLKKCFMLVSNLPTYYSRSVPTAFKDWICLYEKSKTIEVFKSGGENKKNHKRIQIIYDEYNYKVISEALQAAEENGENTNDNSD